MVDHSACPQVVSWLLWFSFVEILLLLCLNFSDLLGILFLSQFEVWSKWSTCHFLDVIELVSRHLVFTLLVVERLADVHGLVLVRDD